MIIKVFINVKIYTIKLFIILIRSLYNNFGSFLMEILRGVYVDSFKLKRPNSIYFLTHWHAGNKYWI